MDAARGRAEFDKVRRLGLIPDPAAVTHMLGDWLSKARFVASRPGRPWPAWSTGELLAVALILDDTITLDYLGYTQAEALDRLRYDIGQPTVAGAAAVFGHLHGRAAGVDGHTGTDTEFVAQALAAVAPIHGGVVPTQTDAGGSAAEGD